ncbi:MAG: DNA gyrase/topoisomerase IV subunit A, partial [Bacteroidia bacterium]
EMLKISTHKTLELLRLELNIRKGEIEEAWHFSSLEKIFIEKRIYRNIEESETWEEVLSAIDKGLKPYKKLFKRAITTDDIARLTEIKIKRISKFDSFKADEHIKNLEEELQLVNHHLEHIVEYAIEYFKNLKKKYGKGRERKTEIKAFEIINATTVAVANEKLYVNREEGFAGYNMKKDEYVCDCSDIDDIIVFRDDGSMSVSKVSDKSFVGKGIIYINVFRKNDERTIYNMIYRDGTKGKSFAKRFAVSGVTRDKIYDLTKGNKGSEVLYFTAN